MEADLGDQNRGRAARRPGVLQPGRLHCSFQSQLPAHSAYSAGLDELRTCLQQTGVPLWQVRQALLPLSGGTTAVLAAVAAERLGMAPHEVDLVANKNFVAVTVAWNTTDPPNDLTG